MRFLCAVPGRSDPLEFQRGHPLRSRSPKISLQLAGLSSCIRIYSVENGLDQVPELAAKVGLKVILGVWLGRDPQKNADLIDAAVSLAKHYPETITALIVGSEVLLRGEMTAGDLRKTIRSAKARVGIPVSYADVCGVLAALPDVGEDVDFVTIHVLPYWEDVPVRAEDAAAHVGDIHRQVALAFPGKEILIGEAGWPSRGRMRDGALPPASTRRVSSPSSSSWQDGRIFASICSRPMTSHGSSNGKERSAAIGACWMAMSRELKYPPGSAVSNYPFWKLQLAARAGFRACVFAAVAFSTRGAGRSRRFGAVVCGGGRPRPPAACCWA